MKIMHHKGHNNFKLVAIICLSVFYFSMSGIFAQNFAEQDGLKYKLFPAAHPGAKPQVGQTAMVDMIFYGDNDQVVFNSTDKKEPVPIPVSKSLFQGDLSQGIRMLSVGDSAIFLIRSDSIIKLSGGSTNLKPGTFLKYAIKLRSIYDASKQLATDDSLIKVYIKKNKIHGVKHTASGLYYKITKRGSGPKPKDGQTIAAHYTGKFTNGNEFDSDKGAGFSFVLGKHEVIQGWEDGFAQLNKGSKAMLFIPSTLAYGVSGGGPIPSNAILIFEVELTDIK